MNDTDEYKRMVVEMYRQGVQYKDIQRQMEQNVNWKRSIHVAERVGPADQIAHHEHVLEQCRKAKIQLPQVVEQPTDFLASMEQIDASQVQHALGL